MLCAITHLPKMTILLDIDGVLVITPAWRTVEHLSDGFLKFNERAASNLSKIIDLTNAAIVLTTTHRINYSVDKWRELFETRGIFPSSVAKLNDLKMISDMVDRATEIKEWVDKESNDKNYVIIDDDLSINGLPTSIKEKFILTKPMIGLDDEATRQAIKILLHN
jgi:hypothetical protein